MSKSTLEQILSIRFAAGRHIFPIGRFALCRPPGDRTLSRPSHQRRMPKDENMPCSPCSAAQAACAAFGATAPGMGYTQAKPHRCAPGALSPYMGNTRILYRFGTTRRLRFLEETGFLDAPGAAGGLLHAKGRRRKIFFSAPRITYLMEKYFSGTCTSVMCI